MTQNVRVTIVGIQIGSGEEAVTTRANGTYHCRNGNHYIQYEEKTEGEEVTKHMIKVTPEQIEIKRSGNNNNQMIFQKSEMTQAQYHTPYGTLALKILTTALNVTHMKDELLITMEYTLSESNSELSKNRTFINITSIN